MYSVSFGIANSIVCHPNWEGAHGEYPHPEEWQDQESHLLRRLKPEGCPSWELEGSLANTVRL